MKAGQTSKQRLLSTSRILSQATKLRLRYKRVDFLGTANHIAMADMVILHRSKASVTGGLR